MQAARAVNNALNEFQTALLERHKVDNVPPEAIKPCLDVICKCVELMRQSQLVLAGISPAGYRPARTATVKSARFLSLEATPSP